jgi:Protein NO VEIN, C-terminal
VAEIEGDGAGYDVLLFTEDGTVKYIEVKTTRGSAETAFFLSANELAFARQHSTHYYIYRLYGYHRETHSGRCYIIEGNPESWCEVTPTQYRLHPR